IYLKSICPYRAASVSAGFREGGSTAPAGTSYYGGKVSFTEMFRHFSKRITLNNSCERASLGRVHGKVWGAMAAMQVSNRRGRGGGRMGRPRPVDVHVGSRVRLRRTMLGMSQEKLGAAIGLTFQQVQKYERGANRIGASRLFELSKVLDVPVSFFFDDMANDVAGSTSSHAP